MYVCTSLYDFWFVRPFVRLSACVCSILIYIYILYTYIYIHTYSIHYEDLLIRCLKEMGGTQDQNKKPKGKR